MPIFVLTLLPPWCRVRLLSVLFCDKTCRDTRFSPARPRARSEEDLPGGGAAGAAEVVHQISLEALLLHLLDGAARRIRERPVHFAGDPVVLGADVLGDREDVFGGEGDVELPLGQGEEPAEDELRPADVAGGGGGGGPARDGAPHVEFEGLVLRVRLESGGQPFEELVHLPAAEPVLGGDAL